MQIDFDDAIWVKDVSNVNKKLSWFKDEKKIEKNEAETVILQRRSISLNKNLKAGSIIKKEDIFYLRPCPSDALPLFKNPIGMKLAFDKDKNEYLRQNDIK